MTEPTQKQIKEFLQWCGFTCYYKAMADKSIESGILAWIQPPDSERTIAYYGLTLDFLFKYAVPKLQDEGHLVEVVAFEHKGYEVRIFNFCKSNLIPPEDFYNPAVAKKDDDPVFALFWAIWKIIEERE